MISSAILATCLLLAQSETNPPKVDVGQSVKRLVRQLDDDELARRDAAEKELTALGPAALDHLPLPTAKVEPETKERLQRVRRALENVLVEQATSPSRVTLSGEMTLADALASIEKQTGNKVVDYRPMFNQEATPISLKLEIKNKTFWETLDLVLDQAKMTVYNFAGEAEAVAIVARANEEVDRAKRAVYAGVLRFEGNRIEATRDLRNPKNHSLRLALDVSWEPRLKPIALVQPLDQLKAFAETGNPLPVDGREGEIEVAAEGDATSAEMYIPFNLPNRSIKKLATLKGKLTILAPGRVETFEFSSLEKARDVEQKRAAVSVVLERMRKNVDVFEVRIRVKFDKAENALESHRGWMTSNPAYLTDGSGKIIDNAGYEVTYTDRDEVGLSYKFTVPKINADHKFVYKTPAAILKLPVEYELKDIDLP